MNAIPGRPDSPATPASKRALFNPNQPADFARGDECLATARRVIIGRFLKPFSPKHIIRLRALEVENNRRKQSKLVEISRN